MPFMLGVSLMPLELSLSQALDLASVLERGILGAQYYRKKRRYQLLYLVLHNSISSSWMNFAAKVCGHSIIKNFE
uniref:Putative ovule protein n=1 Tax=Solanum chacoense TaxID=4108 RepID=A0A0V0HVI3_SOLCH